MFFKDGIFLYNIADIYSIGISKYFEQVDKNTEEGKRDMFYRAFYWGCYVICGDTIKTQYINPPSIGDGYPVGMLFEEWFKVIDKNTVKNIFMRGLKGDKKIMYDAKTMEGDRYSWYDNTYTLLPAKFIPTPVVPGSDCWLKYKKWFWCDENQYEEWKNNIKKK